MKMLVRANLVGTVWLAIAVPHGRSALMSSLCSQGHRAHSPSWHDDSCPGFGTLGRINTMGGSEQHRLKWLEKGNEGKLKWRRYY